MQLRAQLLQAFEKTLGAQDGAFRSVASMRKKRPARTRRVPPALDTVGLGVGALVLQRRPLELLSKAAP